MTTDEIKKIIKDDSMIIQQNSKDNIDWGGTPWIVKQFSHPERTIRLATTFSGIGAIEYAIRRLGLKTEIVFAGDIDKNFLHSQMYLHLYFLRTAGCFKLFADKIGHGVEIIVLCCNFLLFHNASMSMRKI